MASTAAIQLLDSTSIPWLAWGNGSGKARNNPVEMGKVALAAGIRHIDTAQGYNNEAETQEAIMQGGVPTEEVYITSKCMSLYPDGGDIRLNTLIVSQEGGATDKDRIPVSDIRKKVAETTAKIGRVPDLFLIHNRMAFYIGVRLNELITSYSTSVCPSGRRATCSMEGI